MKILYATSEAVPFCKTGGLADVSGSLPAAIAAEGAQMAVVLPLYRRIRDQFGPQLEYLCYDYVNLAWRRSYCGLFRLVRDKVTYYFLDNEQYFNRANLYGYVDDGERFGFFSRAVVRMLPHMAFWPDVIHCNDWQSALIPIYLKDDGVREERYRAVRTVMTIHNIEYQGRFGSEVTGDLFGLDPGWVNDGTIMMDGDVNLLKGAILCADAVTAVSPSYAEELKYAYFAHGMESVMRRCAYKLSGVLNGIDMKRYDPAADPLIAKNFAVSDLSGKAADKAELQKLMGLREEPDTPVLAVVSRLVAHKGLDLIREVFHDIMELPVQMVVLGQGEEKFEEFFSWAQGQYPGRMAAHLGYDEALAMNIYAGADLFLMPSRSEPCGLSQMIAMRYGTVPIVRETGGLKDTVHPYEAWRDAGNGFTFAAYNSGDMLFVIRQAVGLYWDYPDHFHRLRQRCMEGDFSWRRSAGEYLRIYSGITGKPRVKPVGTERESPAGEKVLGKPAAQEESAQPETAVQPAELVQQTESAQPAEPALQEKLARVEESSQPEKTAQAAKLVQARLMGKPEQEKLPGRPPQRKLPAKPEAAALAEKAAEPEKTERSVTKAPEQAKQAGRKTAKRKGSADEKELSADKADE
ncbi:MULTISPECIES: glycogen synthase GlgA [unclassified Oscillibacter]|uniref:glycogen synthase GlgA n=1 Tax=unclassified Oscillibacter TaxID=2629304 RepID=UPI0025CCDDEA|nr:MULTISPECIES: glycogen synthase GlgA [unclassified Oscillibacter]